MERIRFIQHHGRKILLVDCSECQPGQVAEIADQVPAHVTAEPDHSVLLLADFSGSKLTKEAVERIKIAAVRNRQHLRRSAWVFNGNIPKTLHDSVKSFSSRDIPKFETREEALDFLIGGSQSSHARTG